MHGTEEEVLGRLVPRKHEMEVVGPLALDLLEVVHIVTLLQSYADVDYDLGCLVLMVHRMDYLHDHRFFSFQQIHRTSSGFSCSSSMDSSSVFSCSSSMTLLLLVLWCYQLIGHTKLACKITADIFGLSCFYVGLASKISKLDCGILVWTRIMA